MKEDSFFTPKALTAWQGARWRDSRSSSWNKPYEGIRLLLETAPEAQKGK